MTTTVLPRTAAPRERTSSRVRLPRWFPWPMLGGAAIVSATAVALIAAATGGEFSIAGVVALTALLALVAITTVSALVEGRRKAVDRLATMLIVGAFLIALIPLVSVAGTALVNGLPRFDAEFFSSSMRNVSGAGGGALHAIVGTLLITLTATVISVPIALMTAIYLVEYGAGSRLAHAITFLVDVMTGIPSIVAGLFAFALFALILGPANATMGLTGAVALSLLMIPVVVRSCEEMLRLVPADLREASFALGVPKWRTILKVVLPTSSAGIATGVVIAIARVIGETAPLLITAGYTANMNYNLIAERMNTLPLFVYTSYRSSAGQVIEDIDRAWTGALVLILIVLLLNLIARLISRFFAPRLPR